MDYNHNYIFNISFQLFVCTQLHGIKYSYPNLIIYTQLYDFKLIFLFINNLFAHSYMVSCIPNTSNLHTWFQAHLSNTNNFQTDIWSIGGTLTCTSSPDQSEPGSNGNKGVIQTPQSSTTGASLFDAV